MRVHNPFLYLFHGHHPQLPGNFKLITGIHLSQPLPMLDLQLQ